MGTWGRPFLISVQIRARVFLTSRLSDDSIPSSLLISTADNLAMTVQLLDPFSRRHRIPMQHQML
jgi:hypothetical protein